MTRRPTHDRLRLKAAQAEKLEQLASDKRRRAETRLWAMNQLGVVDIELMKKVTARLGPQTTA
jgi:hypothetical protein